MTLLENLWSEWSISLICSVVALLIPLVYLLTTRNASAPTFLDPNVFKELPLIEKKALSYNTRLFRYTIQSRRLFDAHSLVQSAFQSEREDGVTQRRFGLPTNKTILGLPIGQHITFKAKDADGKDIFKPYTPTTDDDTPGHVDFVIKIYPEGRMTQYLEKLQVGQRLLFKGPKGRYQYESGSLKHIGER